MKIPLTKEEYDDVKEGAKYTLLDDYRKRTSKEVRKVLHHELKATEIFSKRSDTVQWRKVYLEGTNESKHNSVNEVSESDLNFGPNNPALLRSKTLGLRRKPTRLSNNFSSVSNLPSLRKKTVAFNQDNLTQDNFTQENFT